MVIQEVFLGLASKSLENGENKHKNSDVYSTLRIGGWYYVAFVLGFSSCIYDCSSSFPLLHNQSQCGFGAWINTKGGV